MDERDVIDIIVIGAGPAGVVAALRAAVLGARTALVTRNEFGDMAANDGPVPLRTLAQESRLIREALFASIRSCQRPRHAFSPPEMSPVDCCSFHRRFRKALCPQPTRSADRR